MGPATLVTVLDDPGEDPKSRSIDGVPIQYPLAV